MATVTVAAENTKAVVCKGKKSSRYRHIKNDVPIGCKVLLDKFIIIKIT